MKRDSKYELIEAWCKTYESLPNKQRQGFELVYIQSKQLLTVCAPAQAEEKK